jgi:pimeloyl-ACP methyl ester carboxylesterase
MEQVPSADGTPIAVSCSGSGPALLLVHGATVDHSYWGYLIPLLEPHFTVYALDRRGRGGSGDTPPYTPDREIEDIQAVLNAIPGPVNLFGHSSGTVLSLETARRAGDKVRRLMLYEPPLFTSTPRLPTGHADRLTALVAAGDREGALKTFLREGPRTSEDELAQIEAGPGWPRMLEVAHTVPYDGRLVNDYDLSAERLAGLHMPIELLLGGASPPRIRAAVEAVAAALPHSQTITLPGQEHMAMVTAPALLAGEMIRFFAA